MKLTPKQKPQTVHNGKEKLRLLPFENEIPCEAIIKFQLRDRVKAADISPWVKVSWDQFMSMRESEKTAASMAAFT
jgi:hypothetical protein